MEGGGIIVPVVKSKQTRRKRKALSVISRKSTAATWKSTQKATHSIKSGDLIMAFDVGQTDMAECVLEVDFTRRPPFKLIEWNILNMGGGTVSSSVSALCTLVKTSKDYWKNNRMVIIEQQDNINVKMVAVSHALEGIINMNGCENIIFASSAHKFEVFKKMDGSSKLIHEEPKQKGAYACKKIRKQNALLLVIEMLHAMPEGIPALNKLQATKASQKDDLADAFVYASSFIFKNQ